MHIQNRGSKAGKPEGHGLSAGFGRTQAEDLGVSSQNLRGARSDKKGLRKKTKSRRRKKLSGTVQMKVP